jgi:hypothetical protein
MCCASQIGRYPGLLRHRDLAGLDPALVALISERERLARYLVAVHHSLRLNRIPQQSGLVLVPPRDHASGLGIVRRSAAAGYSKGLQVSPVALEGLGGE